MTTRLDRICIIGGGPAGCCTAILLALQGWDSLLIEAGDWSPEASAKSQRTLALSQSSWDVLAEIGITPQSMNAKAITTIHVSQRGMPGQVVLDAKDADKNTFGFTVSYGALLLALRKHIDQERHITVHSHCRVDGLQGSTLAARVSYHNANLERKSLLTPLAIVADGGAELKDPHAIHWSYHTEALSCAISSSMTHDGMAWQRFTPEGPIALLPSTQGLALIWTGSHARIQELAALDDTLFLSRLQDWFGDRAGTFLSAGPRLRYPLKSRFSLYPAHHRVVRIANAAQNLHPVAGQGFNLGLRDVVQLRDCLGEGQSKDAGSPSTLSSFRDARHTDRWLTGGVTHLLAQGFTSAVPGVRGLASLALTTLDLSPTLRNRFAGLMSDGLGAS
jgi:2-octaprenyl-6-methoxyphenol hydroxylase